MSCMQQSELWFVLIHGSATAIGSMRSICSSCRMLNVFGVVKCSTARVQ